MKQKITLYLFLLVLFSCDQKISEMDSPLVIIDSIKENESLKSGPHLILDGFDIYYENIPENSTFFKNYEIGYYKFLNPEESRNKYKTEFKNGVVIMTSKLWLPKKNDTRKIIYLVNGEAIEFDEYKKLKLENIVKKGMIEGKEQVQKLFLLNADILIPITTKKNASS